MPSSSHIYVAIEMTNAVFGYWIFYLSQDIINTLGLHNIRFLAHLYTEHTENPTIGDFKAWLKELVAEEFAVIGTGEPHIAIELGENMQHTVHVILEDTDSGFHTSPWMQHSYNQAHAAMQETLDAWTQGTLY